MQTDDQAKREEILAEENRALQEAPNLPKIGTHLHGRLPFF